MNTDKLNNWLALIANLGVLIGIIVVVVELRQTQTAMQADASTVRTEMAIENNRLAIENGFGAISGKLAAGETLTEDESKTIRLRWGRQLRYFENLHYQWQLGVLDEEIWQANPKNRMTAFCRRDCCDRPGTRPTPHASDYPR